MAFVTFGFSDHNRGISEEAADFLVRGLLRRLTVPPAAQSAADKIVDLRHATRTTESTSSIDLTTDEARYVLNVLAAGGWPEGEENNEQLTQLQLALTHAVET